MSLYAIIYLFPRETLKTQSPKVILHPGFLHTSRSIQPGGRAASSRRARAHQAVAARGGALRPRGCAREGAQLPPEQGGAHHGPQWR